MAGNLDIITDPVTGMSFARDLSIPGSTYQRYTPPAGGAAPKATAQSFSSQQPQQQGQQQQPVSATGTPMTPSTGQAYFPNQYALVKIMGQNGYDPHVIWLADTTNKTLRPFESISALEAVYGQPYSQLDAHINAIGPEALGPNGVLGGFQTLSNDFAIDKTGNGKALDYSSMHLASRYGQGVNEDSEMKAYQALDGFLSLAGSQKLGLDHSTINKVLNDPNAMAFYISALAYGGYTLSNVFSDIKRKELGLTNVSPISATQPLSQYQTTTAGAAAMSTPQIKAPKAVSGLSSSVMNLPIFDIPDDAFKKLTPIMDPDSKEFKRAFNKAASVIYESQQQMLTANTEQDRIAAQAVWEKNKTMLEKKLGITLSNDAIEAWKQVEGLQNSASENGIAGSGLMSEQIDEYLKQAQRRNAQNRDATLTDKESQDMQFYAKYASPDQIANLNPALRQKLGLTPDPNVANFFSLASLKKRFPKESDEALQRIRDQYIDKNGNFYSSIYGSLASNTYNNQQNYNQWKEQKVFGDALLNEEKAYSQFTQPDSIFLRGQIDPKLAAKTGGDPNGDSGNSINFKQGGALNNLMNINSKPTAPTIAPSTRPAAPVVAPPAKAPAYVAPRPAAAPAPKPYVAPKPAAPASSVLGPGSIKLPGQITTIQQPTYAGPQQSSPLVTSGAGINVGGVFSGASNWVKSLFGGR